MWMPPSRLSPRWWPLVVGWSKSIGTREEREK
jgi:hypothetical protein